MDETKLAVASVVHPCEVLFARDVLADTAAMIESASRRAVSMLKLLTVVLIETATGILTRRND